MDHREKFEGATLVENVATGADDRTYGAALTTAEIEYIQSLDLVEQDRIFRKVDRHLVPILTLLYLVCHIDRANIGNAKIEGLEAELGMTGTDYNLVAAVFFLPYILFEMPSNMLLIRFKRPSYYLGLLVVSWGTVMTLTGLVNSNTT